jgi:dTMP kinase
MKFYAFEGLKGCGKTTALHKVRLMLWMMDEERAETYVKTFREPGTTELGEVMRQLMIDNPRLSDVAKLHMFLAARAEMIQTRLVPLWNKEVSQATEHVVLMDRWTDSTLAYQGIEYERTAREVTGKGWPWADPVTFFIDTPPELCEERRALRQGKDHTLIIQNRNAYETYQTLAKRNNHVIIDGHLSPDKIAEKIVRVIAEETAWDQQ